MTFIWPLMLFSLLLVPVFVALFVGRQRRQRQNLEKFGSLGLMQERGGNPAGRRRYVPGMLFLAGLAVMLVALARPQTVVGLPSIESTVILAFDVSGSMAADDMQPSRMEAAKAAALDFVERQPDEVKVGVVAFSDGGMSVQAPTDDQEQILAAIGRLTPERGTSLANGILASLEVIAKANGQTQAAAGEQAPALTPTPMPPGTFLPAAIVLLTDGENTAPPDPMSAVLEAANQGVRIYTIGIGSPAGATLEIDGFMVFTQLDEAMLKTIAQLTGGEYFNAQSAQDLRTVYSNLDPQWVIKPEKMEVTSIFAGASMVILLAGALFSLLWYGRLM